MSHRPSACVFFGVCCATDLEPEALGEDELVERYARLTAGFEPKPPRRYGDGTLVSEVRSPIDAQMKKKLFGYAPEHETWVERASAGYQQLGVTLEVTADRAWIFVTASVTLVAEGECARLALPNEGWPGGEEMIRRYCEALQLPFEKSGAGWWLTLARS